MRLYLLELGMAGGYPIPGALLCTDDGRNVLVDSGPAPGSAALGLDAAGQEARRAALEQLYGAGEGADYFHRGDPERALPAQLARIGLTPGDVDAVVSTHLDQDHAGHHHLLAHAEHWIQGEHLRWARATAAPRIALSRDRWDLPGLRVRALDGDAEVAPGVEVVATGGHVPGHQSVLVRLPGGTVLLAGDAAVDGAHLRPDDPAGPFDLDPAAAIASRRRLAALVARERIALVVLGHDPTQWQALRRAPGFYA